MEKNAALLVMDMQAGILGMNSNNSAIIGNVAKAIASARNKKIPVIYIVVGFRVGAPEISENSTKSFASGKAHFATMNMDEFMKVHVDLEPGPGEVVVIKRRVSGFTGSDLEVILRAYGTQHVVLTGISTGGVVLSTLREAADKDYKITLLSDCCIDQDEEVHRVLITKVFPRQAEVITVEEWK